MHWIALQPEPAGSPQAPKSSASTGPGHPLPDALPDALAALGWWALQFTPKVARVSEGGGGDMLVMEVSASERLFGGQKQLIQHIFQSNMPVAPVIYAQAATSLIAVARLKTALASPYKQARPLAQAHQPAAHSPHPTLHPTSHPAPHSPPLPTHRRARNISADDLPLATLAAACPHLPTLARMGCTHWGQLRALPRGGLVRRFGAGLLDALDRAYGLQAELYPWLTLPEVFEATLELQARVETAPALMFGAHRLLNQLQVWLQLRQCGVLALELSWTLDARRNTAPQAPLVVRTAQPTRDMAHLQRLLAEHLARITLPAPALDLRLRTLQTEKQASHSHSLLPDEHRPGDSLHQLLERLGARLGAGNVVQLHTHADHRPEQMQTWQAVSNASLLIANYVYNTGARGLKIPKNALQMPSRGNLGRMSGLPADALYPTWLLAPPLKLAVQHNTPLCPGVPHLHPRHPSPHHPDPLGLLAGPHRIEAGWWHTATGAPGSPAESPCALRDYFLARSPQMGLLWVYRERLGGQDAADWYLHGIFA